VAQSSSEDEERRRRHIAALSVEGDDMKCPHCGHLMADHMLFEGNYEDPNPEVWCCDDAINPRTFTTCGCEGSPGRRTAEQLAAIT
jgi:hypothetical protein